MACRSPRVSSALHGLLRGLAGVVVGACVPLVAQAGGTDDLQAVERLLKTQPRTLSLMKATLDRPHQVYAEMRLGPRFVHLSAARLGPYTLMARAKGSTAPADVQVVVCTATRFLDRQGGELKGDDIFKATRVEETLVSVQLRDVGARDPAPRCPDGR